MNSFQTFNCNICGICTTKIDQNLTMTYANEAFYNLIGYNTSEFEFKFANHFSAILGAYNSKKIHKNLREKKKKESLIIEYSIKNNNQVKWIHTQVNFQRVEEGVIFFVSSDITQYKNIELKYQYTDKRNSLLFDLGNFDYFEFHNETGHLLDYRSKYITEKVLGNKVRFPDYFFKNKLVALMSVDIFRNAFLAIKNGEKKIICEVSIKDKNNQYKWFRASFTLQKQHRALVMLYDITAEKEATIQYLHETLFYQAMLSEQDAFAHLDVTENQLIKVGGLWNFYNEIIKTTSYSDLFKDYNVKLVHPDDQEKYWEFMNPDNLIYAFQNGIFHLGTEFRRWIENNKMCWMYVTVHVFKDQLSQHIMALMYMKNVDIQKKSSQNSFHSEIDYDPLTRVYNKNTSQFLIQNYFKIMNKNELSTIALVDVDNFSHILENYGERLADQTLIKISDMLHRAFRKSDIIGRYDINQFILLLKDYDTDINLKIRLDMLLHEFSMEKNPEISVSIGIATVEGHMIYEQAIKHAEIALFSAKKIEKSKYVFYHEKVINTVVSSEFENQQNHVSQELNAAVDDLNGIEINTEIIQKFNMLAGEEGDIAYLVNPHNYELLCGNQAFYNRIGKSIEECKHKTCYELIHGRHVPCPFCRKANWSLEKYYLYRNFNNILKKEFLIKNKLIEWNEEVILLAFAIDLSADQRIADSIENDTTENNYILNGIHSMQGADSLNSSLYAGLNTIGNFFRAKRVILWEYNQAKEVYFSRILWSSSDEDKQYFEYIQKSNHVINAWIKERKWRHSEIVESPEAMLCFSYDMYQFMKEAHIMNQRWIDISEELETSTIIQIDDVSINFQNSAFMDSFTSFIVSEWKKREMFDQIIYSRDYDTLTGLLNRYSFDQYAHRYNADKVKSIASVCININKLSEINKNNGNTIGDYSLKKVSEFIKQYFNKDKDFRLNGDEFIILITNKDVDYVLDRINKIKEAVDELDIFTISCGYAWDDIEKNLSETILTSIEIMRKNKKLFYHSANMINDFGYQNAQMQLLSSLEKNLYEVWIQPKYDSSSERIYGGEALIRYRDKEYGILPPVKYIPTLEENGLVRFIDLFVFEEVLKLIEKWQKIDREIVISLNFSRVTLIEENLIDNLEDIFKRYQVSKDSVEIEILESYTDVGKSVLYEAIKNLRQAGYRISLDDFGINYTNLSILTDVDVDSLKLDKSLIHSVETQPKTRIVLNHIIEMCHSLKIKVVAEGVETETQRNIVKELGCHLFQGYFFDKPLEVKEFEAKYLHEIKQKVR